MNNSYDEKEQNLMDTPEWLVEDTLNMMLVRNAQLSKKTDDAQRNRSLISRAILPVAACVCLLIGLTALLNRNNNQIAIWTFDYNVLPAAESGYRSSSEDDYDDKELTRLFGLDTKTLLEGYTCTNAQLYRISTTQDNSYSAVLFYQNDSHTVKLTVATAEPVLMAELMQGEKTDIGDQAVYFGRDSGPAGFFASWAMGGTYFSLNSSTLKKGPFVDITESVVLRATEQREDS